MATPLEQLANETFRPLKRALDDRLRAVRGVILRAQLPLALSDDSEPEPDIAIVPAGDYRTQHPTHAILLIEVADASLAKDRGPKARLYAAAGIPEYWIVNLVDRVVEVHTGPSARGYASIETVAPGNELRSDALPGLVLAVADLLP